MKNNLYLKEKKVCLNEKTDSHLGDGIRLRKQKKLKRAWTRKKHSLMSLDRF
jgi:hypothetical protein